MFREMRREDRRIDDEEARGVLERAQMGVLALAGGEYPYAVPMNFVIIEGDLYFHASLEGGEKDDRLDAEAKACFMVLEHVEGACFRSVACFGHVVRADDRAQEVLERIVEKHVPEFAWESAKEGIPARMPLVRIYRFDAERTTGKFVDKPA